MHTEETNLGSTDEKPETEILDEPVDAVGGEGEFAFVAESGLPLTSADDEDQGDRQEENPEIPSISRKISAKAAEAAALSGLTNVGT